MAKLNYVTRALPLSFLRLSFLAFFANEILCEIDFNRFIFILAFLLISTTVIRNLMNFDFQRDIEIELSMSGIE